MKDLFSWPAIKKILDQQFTGNAEILSLFRVRGLRLLKVLGEQKSVYRLPVTRALPAAAPGESTTTTSTAAESPIVIGLPSLNEVREYSAIYFSLYNPLIPILSPGKYFSHTLPRAIGTGFVDGGIASIIVLLVAALGQCAKERTPGVPSRRKSAEGKHDAILQPPGLELFNQARRCMGFEITEYTLEHVQMFSLAA